MDPVLSYGTGILFHTSIFIISFKLMICLPHDLTSGVPFQLCVQDTMCAAWPFHLIFLDFTIVIIFEVFKLWASSL
jgi:hypothetical protein